MSLSLSSDPEPIEVIPLTTARETRQRLGSPAPVPSAAPPPLSSSLLRAGGPLPFHLPRAVWYACALWTAVTTAGAVYGWVSMASILQREGVFAELCGERGGGCKEQKLALSSVYTAASTFAYVSPVPLGMYLDARGPRAAVALCMGIFACGPALGVAAASSGVHALYYPAFVAMGIASSAMLVPLYSVANLFPRWQGILLAVLNGAFDAASLVFRVFEALYAAGVPLRWLWVAYLAVPVGISGLIALLVWRSDAFPFVPVPAKEEGVVASEAGHAEAASGTTLQRGRRRWLPSLDGGFDTARLHGCTFWQQLCSAEFVMFAAFFCGCMLRFNVFISSVHPQMEALGQSPAGEVRALPAGLGLRLLCG